MPVKRLSRKRLIWRRIATKKSRIHERIAWWMNPEVNFFLFSNFFSRETFSVAMRYLYDTFSSEKFSITSQPPFIQVKSKSTRVCNFNIASVIYSSALFLYKSFKTLSICINAPGCADRKWCKSKFKCLGWLGNLSLVHISSVPSFSPSFVIKRSFRTKSGSKVLLCDASGESRQRAT